MLEVDQGWPRLDHTTQIRAKACVIFSMSRASSAARCPATALSFGSACTACLPAGGVVTLLHLSQLLFSVS